MKTKIFAVFVAIAVTISMVAMPSCAGMNPIKTALTATPEHKAKTTIFATYGSWVAVTESAAKMVEDPNCEPRIKTAIKEVDNATYKDFDVPFRASYKAYTDAEKAVLEALKNNPDQVQAKIDAAKAALAALEAFADNALLNTNRMRQAMR